jgi:collagenase-like PrtC family protease
MLGFDEARHTPRRQTCGMTGNKTSLTLGSVLFHWAPEKWRDFYFRIADEAPVDTVYLGEVVCAKRAVFYEPLYAEVAARLEKAGKRVVFSTLAEVALPLDRRIVDGVCSLPEIMVEANDAAALAHLSGRPHVIGQMMNVYNEDALAFVARNGARHVCLPVELPASAIAVQGKAAKRLGMTLEAQVYGRLPLALSARCYHARAEGNTKDSCQFACGKDPDGRPLKTLEGKPFLAINGIQTMSYGCFNLIREAREIAGMGVTALRLSPHDQDMVKVAQTFRDVLDEKIGAVEGVRRLSAAKPPAPFCNGFYYKKQGGVWVEG